MASSRITLNGPDWKDLAEALIAFERQNNVRIVITFRTCKGTEAPDMWAEAKAIGKADSSGVPSLLVLASVRCGGSNFQTVDAAVLSLLYQLDFQLAEREWAASAPKKA